MGLLEVGPMFPLWAVPGQAPWVKARPPAARHRALPPGLAPRGGPGDPCPGKGTVGPSILLIKKGIVS